jgi:benzylsuccinate CoA-transferase BbsE subunit
MLKPYDDDTILDLTHDFGRYVGRLFADLGATTIRVEPPEGLPDRVRMTSNPAPEFVSAFAFLNASKQSVVLDLESPEGMEEFGRLAAKADIVIVETGGPLHADLDLLRSIAGPSTVITSISPFGREGPRADDPVCDLVLQAAGGIAWLSGRPGE